MISVFEDYFSFKKENKDLLQKLVSSKSLILSHISSVIIVVDYLYEKHMKKRALSGDEEYIFMMGFDYLYECMNITSIVLKEYFNNDVSLMNNYPKALNMIFYVNEYKTELKAREGFEKYIVEFERLEDEAYKSLKEKVDLADEYFGILDDLVYKSFEANDIDSPSIESIFYEIALEYHILEEDTETAFNKIFSTLVEKNRK